MGTKDEVNQPLVIGTTIAAITLFLILTYLMRNWVRDTFEDLLDSAQKSIGEVIVIVVLLGIGLSAISIWMIVNPEFFSKDNRSAIVTIGGVMLGICMVTFFSVLVSKTVLSLPIIGPYMLHFVILVIMSVLLVVMFPRMEEKPCKDAGATCNNDTPCSQLAECTDDGLCSCAEDYNQYDVSRALEVMLINMGLAGTALVIYYSGWQSKQQLRNQLALQQQELETLKAA
jgi:MFS family permease